MYIAELRGKLSERTERSEDILTSNVFSFFKYAERRKFLKSLLAVLLGIQVSDQDAQDAEFQFWPRYADNTEPDLVLIAGRYYLLIEAKFHSSFEWLREKELSQLFREMNGGLLEARSLEKDFYLVTVTADYVYRPENFVQIEGEIPSGRLKWVNWQQIGNLLIDILEKEDIPSEARLFCQDLISLLDKKNLRSFRDIKSIISVEMAFESLNKIFLSSETTILRGDFVGFLPTLSALEPLGVLPHAIFFPSRPLFTGIEGTCELKGLTGKIFFRKEA